MKNILLCAWIVFSVMSVAEAQTTQKKRAAKTHHTVNKTVKGKKNKTEKLNATGTHSAKGAETISSNHIANAPINNATTQQLQIADPVLKAINRSTARGMNSDRVMMDIIGIRRATYGVANGHITFLPGGARSSGATTGSGAVGTGTSPGVIGAGGHAMGLNGKNPYSGPGIYGSSLYGITTIQQTRNTALGQLKSKNPSTLNTAVSDSARAGY